MRSRIKLHTSVHNKAFTDYAIVVSRLQNASAIALFMSAAYRNKQASVILFGCRQNNEIMAALLSACFFDFGHYRRHVDFRLCLITCCSNVN